MGKLLKKAFKSAKVKKKLIPIIILVFFRNFNIKINVKTVVLIQDIENFTTTNTDNDNYNSTISLVITSNKKHLYILYKDYLR